MHLSGFPPGLALCSCLTPCSVSCEAFAEHHSAPLWRSSHRSRPRITHVGAALPSVLEIGESVMASWTQVEVRHRGYRSLPWNSEQTRHCLDRLDCRYGQFPSQLRNTITKGVRQI